MVATVTVTYEALIVLFVFTTIQSVLTLRIVFEDEFSVTNSIDIPSGERSISIGHSGR